MLRPKSSFPRPSTQLRGASAASALARFEQQTADSGQRQTMLSDELHHRVQNTLAVVLALARITARSVSTIEAFQAAFEARVLAMARTNALLLRDHAQAVDVRTALEMELDVYGGKGAQISLACEPIAIAADAALSLSLLIHELATNAAKYGGLSTSAGRLDIRCWREAGGAVLTWRETSPTLEPNADIAGQGSVLIRHLARDLGGTARIDIRPGGLEATITFRPDGTRVPAASILEIQD
jgi:two-component sensor histidine kinase